MNGKLHCAMVAVDGGVASTIFGPLELLYFCRQVQLTMPEVAPCEFRTELLSPGGQPFSCVTGHRHEAEAGLKDLPAGAVILLPGFGLPPAPRIPELLCEHAELGAWLRRQHAAGCSIAAWCSGAFLLAEHGLLPQGRATIHWAYAGLFRERYPGIALDMDARVVEGDRVSCLAGTACGMDTVLSIIETHVGREVARLCAKMIGLETRRPSELRYEERQPTVHDDPMVEKAVRWIRGHLHQKLSVDDVLQRVPASRRNFSRRFRTETGESLQAFIQRLRLERAKLLLETSGTPIERIVGQVGYQDASAFSRQFKRYTRLTPLQYRQRFGLSAG